ncbi:MAG: AAA family ATPase [Spirochaetes bacterium]|nr:AAA family ATPase [Spirochaetota bacterium]
MQYIRRALQEPIAEKLNQDNRLVLLLGPRQAGKTTLAKAVMDEVARGEYLLLSGEDPRTAERISSCELSRLRGIFSGYRYVLLDEAQHIPNVGTALKIVHDNRSAGEMDPRILVTGSSSLSLAGGTREALTGRTWSYTLYPIAFTELRNRENPFELEGRLPEALVLGMYPALFSLANRGDRVDHLRELSTAYLYRDVLELGGIRNSSKLRDLLRLLAYQIGSEVSYQELGRQVGLGTDTVMSYIDLLEKAYVVFRLGAFSRNLRKEISKKDKVFFYDNGVRNILIEDTKEWDLRGDAGALWENFLVSERLKANSYARRHCAAHFWRVYTGAEIDYVEEEQGQLAAYEFKLKRKAAKPPHSFLEIYSDARFDTVHMENWLEFVS